MTRARDLSNLIGSGSFSSTTFTATAGQTVFTIAHTQGFVQVFMNGLLLDLTVDYTSNGSAITLTSAAVAGDEIEVVKYDAFSVGDAIRASGGTFTGSIDASAGLVTPAGHIVQTVKSSISVVSNSTTSSTPAEINSVYRVAITPTSTSSTILWMMNAHLNVGAATFGSFAVYRSINGGAYTSINVGNGREAFRQRGGETDQRQTTIMYYDTPNTTNEVIYTPYWFRHSGGNSFYTNDNGMGSFCMAFEIAG